MEISESARVQREDVDGGVENIMEGWSARYPR
jgi:hypothetical protein